MTARATGAPVMVFAGEFWRGSSGFGLAQGFRSLGWAVHEIDLSRLLPNAGTSMLVRGARRLLTPTAIRVFEQAAREAVTGMQPDIFLTIKGTNIKAEFLRWLRHRGVTTVVFYPDFHFDHPGVLLDDFGAYDVIITTKTFQLEMLRRRFGARKVSYVPHGYSDGIHRPIRGELSENDYDADLQHVGAHSSYKQRWLAGLTENCPNATFRIFGARWSKSAVGTSLQKCTVGDSLYDCAYSIALQTARINVAVMMGPHESGWQDNVSTRTFEIPACGGFMLHIDNDEVREFFKPGEEIDVFSSPEELADKARFYLAKPEQRLRMIQRAYARCVPAYGYGARAAEMMQIIGRPSRVVPAQPTENVWNTSGVS